MSESKPQRVRVTGPPRRATIGPRSRLGDVHEQTEIGDVYLRSLLREQFALAVRVLLTVALTIGLLPLLFVVWPDLAARDVLGLPVAWLLLGVVVYPYVLVLGWRYVRRVERNERAFADLVDVSGPVTGPPTEPVPDEPTDGARQ